MTVPIGTLIDEGKTKRRYRVKGDDQLLVLESLDRMTAGDGAKVAEVPGKGALSAAINANVFRLLQQCGIQVAWREQLDDTHFVAERLNMLELEVVARREAHGSFVKRHPHLPKGHVLPRLVVEFFLKTKNKNWYSRQLPKDDPLVVIRGDQAALYLPDQPLWTQAEPFLILQQFPAFNRPELFSEMERRARQVFLILEKVWQLQGRRLVDFKIEFGLNRSSELVLGDVIDAESWRIVYEGQYEDKQLFREGRSPDETVLKFAVAAELSRRFGLPRQRIILWRASDKDGLTPFHAALKPYLGDDCQVAVVTCSAHKEPVRTTLTAQRLVQEIPDCVIIAYVGRSNGLGPMLAAAATAPVITVPASEQFCHDVWSSLRAPSQVPVMTVLEPGNAVLAALQIMALRNPRLYALLRLKQEERQTNIVELG